MATDPAPLLTKLSAPEKLTADWCVEELFALIDRFPLESVIVALPRKSTPAPGDPAPVSVTAPLLARLAADAKLMPYAELVAVADDAVPDNDKDPPDAAVSVFAPLK